MTHLLVPMLGDTRDIVALDTAAKLANPSGAQIDARLFVRDPRNIVPYVGEGVNAEAIAQVVAEGEKQVKRLTKNAETTFRDWCAKNKIKETAEFERGHTSATFSVLEGSLPNMIVPLARLSDACIFPSSAEEDGPDRSDLMMTAMLESGRPALLAPSVATPKIGSRIAIAWNGSLEATRAVVAAMPLMKQAEAVFVIGIDDPENAFNTSGMAATLQMNGIAATSIKADSEKVSVGIALANEAKKVSADLLVIGAYSHSRLREAVFGGVTSDTIKHPNLPILLVH